VSDKKLLTILIPAYNGAKFLSGLLHSFANYVASARADERFLRDCEILVVNNRSTDNTLEIARSIGERIPNLRIETPAEHVPTAEENVFRSFKQCRGEYTWVLGCDDIVRFEALAQVIDVAQHGKYDLAIFNFMQSDKDGGIETYCNYFMRNDVYEGDLVGFTQRMGFWWLIAGFSGQIVRTSRVMDYDHSRLVTATSPIYSHVTAYLECLARGSAAILNVQNVVYRLSDNDADHWRRAAALMNVFDEYFWTLGYIRQIKYLEDRGIVGADYLIKMIESNREGFFRPTVAIYDKLLSQLRLMRTIRSRRDDRNNISESEFEEVMTYLEQRDLLARPFLITLREIFSKLVAGQNPGASFEQARQRLQSYRSTFILSPQFIGIDADYEIYEISNVFYAVHRFFRKALLDVVRYLDPLEQAPIVFSGRNRAEVADRIRRHGVALAWDAVPPSLMRYYSTSFVRDDSSAAASNSELDATLSRTLSGQIRSLTKSLRELKNLYRSNRSRSARLAAWTTALGVKATRRLLSTQSASDRETIRA
jgi:glycosyltransferase involved in cell wall biosynthesis